MLGFKSFEKKGGALLPSITKPRYSSQNTNPRTSEGQWQPPLKNIRLAVLLQLAE
jgi:hypothetical protein